MGMKEFGEYIESLCEERTFINSRGKRRTWTQAELARQTGLSVRQIGSIIRGDTSGVRDDIPLFIDAFKLDKDAANFLYRLGEYHPPIDNTPAAVDKLMIQTVFEKLAYPASARNFLWDFIAFNSFHYELFGYTPERIAALRADDNMVGANLLRVLCDPFFDHKYKVGEKEENWREDVLRNLRIYRSKTITFASDPRRKEILTAMEEYNVFRDLWPKSEFSGSAERELQHPTTIIHTHDFEDIEFVSLRVHQYLGEDVDISVYVPRNEHEEKYRRFQASVLKKMNNHQVESIYFFDRSKPVRKMV